MSVEVLVGNIASGKSTYCKQRVQEGALVVNDDAIVNAVHSNDYTLYDVKLKPLYKAVENQIVISAITLGRDVLIDRGLNLTPKSRRRWIGLAHSMDVDCRCVVFKFEEPAVHANRRKQHDLRGHTYEYWLEVAEKFNNKHVSPTVKEGFDKIINYSHSCNRSSDN